MSAPLALTPSRSVAPHPGSTLPLGDQSPRARQHVAIIDRHAADHLLAGRKTVESRFSRRRRPPFGWVWPGNRIYFKISGAEFVCACAVREVRHFCGLAQGAVAGLRQEFGPLICADDPYWAARRHCRYAVLIWLDPPQPCPEAAGIEIPRQYGGAGLCSTPPKSAQARSRPGIPAPPSSAAALARLPPAYCRESSLGKFRRPRLYCSARFGALGPGERPIF